MIEFVAAVGLLLASFALMLAPTLLDPPSTMTHYEHESGEHVIDTAYRHEYEDERDLDGQEND